MSSRAKQGTTLPGMQSVVRGTARQSPCPGSFDPTSLRVSKQYSFELRKVNPRECHRLIRMLLSKVAHEGRSALAQDEEVLLVLLYERWSSIRDPAFLRALGERVISSFTYCYHWIRGTLKVPPQAQDGDLPFFVRTGILASAHAYYGWWTSFRVSDFLRTINRARLRAAPPKRFVGVGYRDAGQARNPAYDGSPSWQEVALSNRTSHLVSAQHEAFLEAGNRLILEGYSCRVEI